MQPAMTAPALEDFVRVFTAFLNVWRHNDFGASLDRMLERAGEGWEIRDGDHF